MISKMSIARHFPILGAALLVSCTTVDRSVFVSSEATDELLSSVKEGYANNTIMKFETAENAYRTANLITAAKAAQDPLETAEQQLLVALNKSNQGSFERAEQLFLTARPIINSGGGALSRMTASIYYAQHKLNSGDPVLAEAEALTSVQAARAARVQANQPSEATPSAGRRSVVTSFEITREEEAIINASGIDDNQIDIGTLDYVERLKILEAHGNFILAAVRRGSNDQRAAENIDNSIKLLETVPPSAARWLRASIKLESARILEEGGDLELALSSAGDAVSISQRFAWKERPEALAHLARGRLLAQQGRADDAVAAYEKAIGVLAQGGRGISFDQIAPYLRLLVDDATYDPTGEKAILALQQLRSPVTATTLARAAARLETGNSIEAQAIRRFQDAERQLNRLSAEIDRLSAQEGKVNSIGVARKQFILAQAELDGARAQLEKGAPNYDQLLDRSVSLSGLRAVMQPDEVIVMVRSGDTGSVIAAITPSGFQMDVTSTSRAELTGLTERVRATIVEPEFDVAAAQDLYRFVLAPVQAALEGAKTITFIPDGPLLSVPVGLYVAEGPLNWSPGSFDYSGIPWLGTDRSVSFAMSPVSLVLLRRAAQGGSKRVFAGFADFKPFGAQSAGTVQDVRAAPQTCGDLYASIGGLPELRNSLLETQQVGAFLNAGSDAILSGRGFTDAAFRSGFPSDSAVVHIASHALLPISEECLPEPAIVTSLGGANSDGLLEASEIVEISLNADLVVLSACDTGGIGASDALGTGLRGGRGESLTGLARAFFYAGARNLVASHWFVPDAETADLMISFYAGIRDEIPIADAMMIARRDMARDPKRSHPFFWSGFSVFGDGTRKLDVSGLTL
ncbi:MAG: CHAT domain-containing tetratricopeptide repeat protein [Pseudomonadota bacterium]